jgi:hypothetical protein
MERGLLQDFFAGEGANNGLAARVEKHFLHFNGR